MMNHKKTPKIDRKTIESFKEIEQAKIIERIITKENAKKSFSILKYRYQITSMAMALIVALVIFNPFKGLNSEIEPCHSNEVYIDGECYNIDDIPITSEVFYQYLVQYKEHLENITEDVELDKAELVFLSNLTLPDENKYYLEDYLPVYNNQVYDPYENQYMTELLEMEGFLDDVINLLDGKEFQMREYIELIPMQETYYRFNMSSNKDVLIEVVSGIEHWMYKIGLDEEELVVKAIMYAGEADSFDIAEEYNFFYFEFIENRESVVINSNEFQISTTFASEVEKIKFSLSSGIGVAEGMISDEVGTIVTYYDTDQNIRKLVELVNDDITMEFYDVFNDKGVVFSYGRSFEMGNEIELTYNLLEATGWDYVYKEDMDNWSTEINDNVYQNDVALFPGERVRTYINDHHVLLSVVLHKQESEITDLLLNLNEHNLEFYNGTISLDFIEDMRVKDVSEIEEHVQYKGIGFFSENIKTEIIESLDIDLKRALETAVLEERVPSLNNEYEVELNNTYEETITFGLDYDLYHLSVAQNDTYSYEIECELTCLFEVFDADNQLLNMTESSGGRFIQNDLVEGDYYIRITNTDEYERANLYSLTVYQGSVEENDTLPVSIRDLIDQHTQYFEQVSSYQITYSQDGNMPGMHFRDQLQVDKNKNRISQEFTYHYDQEDDVFFNQYAKVNENWYRIIGTNTIMSNGIGIYHSSNYFFNTIIDNISDVDANTENARYMATIPFEMIQHDLYLYSRATYDYVVDENPTVDVTIYHNGQDYIYKIDILFQGDDIAPFTLSIEYSHFDMIDLEPVESQQLILDDYPSLKTYASDIYLGNTVTGIINELYDTDTFKLEVSANGIYHVTLDSVLYNHVRIIDELDEIVLSFSGFEEIEEIYFEEGTYYVLVIGLEYRQEDNEYQFTIE